MFRSYEYQSSSYHGGDSRSSIDEYLERVTRMERMPSVVADCPHFPNVYEALNNNARGDHLKKNSHMNYQKHHAPEVPKKVHCVEHEEVTQIGRGGKREVHEEKAIDVEADGVIAKKHNNFQLCKWDTFKHI